MKNEVQRNTPPVQPIPQASTSVPDQSSTNWAIILLFTLLGLVVIAGSVFAGIQIGKGQTSNQQRIVTQPTIPPTQTVVNPTDQTTAVPTSNLETLTSNQFGFSLKYPNDWTYYKNGNNDVLKLPYVRNLSAQNETLAKTDGCAIHFGFGGGSGPSNDIQSQTVSVGSLNYTKKLWLIEGKPVFASYLYDGVSPATKKFELLFTWISNTNTDLCQKEIDQILSTFEFSK